MTTPEGSATKSGDLQDNAASWLERHGPTARDAVVVTPWFSRSPVERLLAALPTDATLRFVFRWPQTDSDCLYLSASAAQLLARDERVTMEFINGPLHAKVYLFGGRALVTSANLTDAGLGARRDPARRNIELGIDAPQPAQVQAWLDGLDTEELDAPALTRLVHTLETTNPPKPMPVAGPPAGPATKRAAFARQVMQSAGIEPIEPIRGGMGQNAWNAPLFRRERANVKVQVSQRHMQSITQFDFLVTRADHERMRSGTLHGLLYATRRVDVYESPPDAPALILVPAGLLCNARRGVAASTFDGRKKITAYVERAGRGWQIRIPQAGSNRAAVGRLVPDRRWNGRVYRMRSIGRP